MTRYTLRPSRRTAMKRARSARKARDGAMCFARDFKARGLPYAGQVDSARIYNRRVVECLRLARGVRP